jgi:hypothetical protein
MYVVSYLEQDSAVVNVCLTMFNPRCLSCDIIKATAAGKTVKTLYHIVEWGKCQC